MRPSRGILFTQKPTIWLLQFEYEDIYSRVSLDTVYTANKNAMDNDNHIVLDDDRPLFNYYLALAISDLTSLLARRIDPTVIVTDDDGNIVENEGMVETSDNIIYYLVMDKNFEEYLRSSLWRYCQEFLAKRVMEMWHKSPQGADMVKSNIIRILEFRRIPVRRPIRNML